MSSKMMTPLNRPTSQSMESLCNYLIRHGALSPDEIEVLNKVKDPNRKLDELVARAAGSPSPKRQLFINALRCSGRYAHASEIDDTPVISPVSSKSKQRQKGFLTLKLVPFHPSEIAERSKPLKIEQLNSSNDLIIKPNSSHLSQKSKKPAVWTKLCCCFSTGAKMSERNSYSKDRESLSNSPAPLIENNYDITPQLSPEQIEKFKKTRVAIARQISDSNQRIHDVLLKYLEQKRGVLVNDVVQFGDEIQVTAIFMSAVKLDEIWNDHLSKMLGSDLSGALMQNCDIEDGSKFVIETFIDENEYQLTKDSLTQSNIICRPETTV